MKVQNLVVTEKYMKNGEEKKAYKTIGKLFTYDDGGMSVKIEMVPTGAWDGNASVYDIQPRQQTHVNNGQNDQRQNNSGNYNSPQGYGQGNGQSQRQNVPVYQEQVPQNGDQPPF